MDQILTGIILDLKNMWFHINIYGMLAAPFGSHINLVLPLTDPY